MMLVTARRRAALNTIFMFMGSTLGAMEILEAFDDALEAKHRVAYWPDGLEVMG